MGAIAEAFAAYAQPLIDQTDGSEGQLNRAFAISQLCYNLALLPEDSQDQSLSEMQSSLQMEDKEFDDFRRSIVVPMIRRHQEKFPRLHIRRSSDVSQVSSTLIPAAPAMPTVRNRRRSDAGRPA
jgi:hypothetical protein